MAYQSFFLKVMLTRTKLKPKALNFFPVGSSRTLISLLLRA